jgi:hypothetical protein
VGQLLALCNTLAVRWPQHYEPLALPVLQLAIPSLQYCSRWVDLLPVEAPMPNDEMRSFMQVVYPTITQPLTPPVEGDGVEQRTVGFSVLQMTVAQHAACVKLLVALQGNLIGKATAK